MQELIARVIRKERKACLELYDRYAKPMYNMCLRILNDENEAEDVLQESFVRVFEQLHTLNQIEMLSAWIKKICVNTCLQHLQQRRKWRIQDEVGGAGLYTIQDEESTIEEMGHLGNMEAIHNAISELPEGYRVVFVMHAIEDYTHEEIAKLLGIGSSTSRSQYLRGKKKLLEILKKNYANVRSAKKFSAAT